LGAHNDHNGVGTASVDHDSVHIVNTVMKRYQPTAEQMVNINRQIAQWRLTHQPRADSTSNGADDDGSGSVSLLEIAEYIQSLRVKPKRSILFVWHTGEERGLWGSEYFTDHPTVPRDSIVTQLNLDMVGRGDSADTPGGGPNYLLLIGSRRLSTELGDLVETANRGRAVPMKFDYSWDANGHPEQIYCRSDHYNYARYGIPITFFTTGLHGDYHKVTDEPQYIDYDHMARVASLVADVALRVGNLSHRPVVDKPKPDPTKPCAQ